MRVYDSDFASQSDPLINLAAEIALDYNGNWEAMIDWKRHCRAAIPLDIKQARTILNMTLSDVTQHRYHQRIKALTLRGTPPFDVGYPERPESPRHVVVPREPTRMTRWSLDTRVRIPSGLFRPEGWNAKIHYVDQLRSHLRWKVPGECAEGNDAPKVPTELYLYGWCGKHYKNPTIEVYPDVPPPEDEICRGCLRTKRDVGYPPSGAINFRGQTYARYWRPE